jgi:hypothetical protein
MTTIDLVEMPVAGRLIPVWGRHTAAMSRHENANSRLWKTLVQCVRAQANLAGEELRTHERNADAIISQMQIVCEFWDKLGKGEG